MDAPIDTTLHDEEQVRLIFETAYFAECNDVLARSYGLEHARDAIGLRLSEVLGESKSENNEVIRCFVREGYRLRNKQTREIDIHGKGYVFLNSCVGILEHGALQRIWGTHVDITDQVQSFDALRARTRILEAEVAARTAAEGSARASAQLNRAVLASLPDQIAVIDDTGTIIAVNDTWARMGAERDASSTVGVGVNYLDVCRRAGDSPLARGALEGIEAVLRRSRESFQIEYPCHPPSDEAWYAMTALPLHGEAGGAVIGHSDITARKIAEQVVSEASGRIIQAQEEERQRIARELHDDLNQQLALISIELDLMRHDSDCGAAFHDRTEALLAKVQMVSSVVHRIAHRLHPAKLDRLGLAAAVEGLCRELGEQYGLEITSRVDGDLSPVTPEVQLCLYRIVQEALANTIRHGDASQATVHLWHENTSVGLRVTDNGRGFDPSAPRHRRGLGLVSMEERAILVGGRMVIESAPSRGTTIEVTVAAGQHASETEHAT